MYKFIIGLLKYLLGPSASSGSLDKPTFYLSLHKETHLRFMFSELELMNIFILNDDM